MLEVRLLAAACLAVLVVGGPALAAKPKAVPLPTPVLLAPAAPEAEGFDSARLARLTAAMHDAVDNKKVAGIQTMLVRHGRVVQFDTYGQSSIAAGTPLTSDSIFRMYSQTKPTIGVAMMILYEQGKWRLEDPVKKFIPELANLKVFGGLDKNGQPILEDMKHEPTMRELVTHTAGFGYGLANDNYVDQQFQAQKIFASNGLPELASKVATIPLRYQPGTRWSYSIAVDLQGYIIEKLSGMKLSEFMAKNLWGPLGMKDTGFYVPPEKASRLSGVYFLAPQTSQLIELNSSMPNVQDFTKVPPIESGGGGSVGTSADYARFCQMILNGGELGGVRVLSPSSIAMIGTDLLEPTVMGDPDRPRFFSFGGDALGFGVDFAVVKQPLQLGTFQGKGSIWWGGAAGTWFWIDPTNDLFFLGMIQRFGGSMTGNDGISVQSQTLVYQALTNPSK